ncbi:MAG: nickel pincer cofactor biosynthesis protein LarC, partial [Akkermansiaceae bacterium]|nr:nickel pincer cofactor biosynthesis protein LarC [Akkermansiaceae bacterium]
MRTAYFDCFSGISGDMCLGALIDAGVSADALRKCLGKLPLKSFELDIKKVSRAGIKATAVTVRDTSRQSPARRFSDVRDIISRSKLPQHIKERGLAIFEALFRAEARVHGSRYDRVHLHELGAVDALVDILGTLILLDSLGIGQVYASAVNLGSGTVRTEHGELPVPAPATVELLRDIPSYGSDTGFELTTPTGAVIISTLSAGFGPMPQMRVRETGYGAGKKNLKTRPNVLRVLIGDGAGGDQAGLVVLETNIDDMNPQIFPHVMDRLFGAGALDVWLTQIIMKKGRPAVTLSVLCEEPKRGELTGIILRETTTLGVRFWGVSRSALERRMRTVKTPYGPIRY